MLASRPLPWTLPSLAGPWAQRARDGRPADPESTGVARRLGAVPGGWAGAVPGGWAGAVPGGWGGASAARYGLTRFGPLCGLTGVDAGNSATMRVVRGKSHGIIAVLHPGEMGAAVGRCLTGSGHQVLWASQGRGTATAARAEAAGLADARSIEEVAGRAEIIMSICPPHAALEVARAVAGFQGMYVDANAISPATAREVAGIVEAGGASYVDGGIIGA